MKRSHFTTIKHAAIIGLSLMFTTSCDQLDLKPQPEVRSTQESGRVELPTQGTLIPGKYIVVYKDGVAPDVQMSATYKDGNERVKDFSAKMLEKHGIEKGNVKHVFSKVIKGFSASLTKAQVKELKNDPDVDFVEQDQIVTLGRKPKGGGGGSAPQETPWGITRVNGGANYNGSNVAWVIDTGIDLDHADLNVDASRGFNAFTKGKDGRSTDDGNGHGTHVAGTIGAINNSIGVIGVAAGATVIPVKVLGATGSGSNSGVIAGVDHVGANAQPGDVVNMSLGGGVSQALDNAVLNAVASSGAIFCLAAGNEASHANTSSPGRVNGQNIYTISAMDSNDYFASFSNYGNPPVDYCLPGVDIKSTWKSGGYNTISGTSMACPHAAGVLLASGGSISVDGTVNGDPDGNPDFILVK
jgi:subtilisin family serine protease